MFWRRKHKTDWQGSTGPATITTGQLAFGHLAILEEIASPWTQASRQLGDAPRTHANVEAAFRRAFRGITDVQLAEYVFVTSRPPAESRAILTRGRGEFSKAALAVLKTMISSETVSHLVADDGALLVSAIVKQTDSSALTKSR
jgi:hypothetical protein